MTKHHIVVDKSAFEELLDAAIQAHGFISGVKQGTKTADRLSSSIQPFTNPNYEPHSKRKGSFDGSTATD